jgi:hypothetical protein
MNTDFLLFDDFKTETKYGIQTLDFMVRFIKILNAKKCQSTLDSFKAWLCSQIKRGITEQEVVSILREGMEAKAPIANQLRRSDECFISEMEATFGVY